MRLPRSLHLDLPVPGFTHRVRVAHLTDLHAGWSTPASHLRCAVTLANVARPDLVVLTGDYVGYSLHALPTLVDVLSALEAPTVAVLGNHDHWVDAERVSEALQAAGAQVLRNASVTVAGITVVGLDDHGTGHADADAATRGLDGPALGLSHHPMAAPTLWERGVPLVLSGHTHAGQVRGPWTPLLWRHLGWRDVEGLCGEPGAQVYVNAGIGSASLPWRAGKPAWHEVAILDLGGA